MKELEPRVFVVDDDRSVRTSLATLLEAEDYVVEHKTHWTRVWDTRQIFGGAGKRLDDIFLRLQQSGQARPDRPVVIHHEHARFQFFHPRRPR